MTKQTFVLHPDEHRHDRMGRCLGTIAALPVDKPFRVTIEPYQRRRNLDQNALYWATLGEIARETGNSTDALHEYCKATYLPRQTIEINGDVREVPQSTTKLSVGEMAEYVGHVRALAAELGIRLPAGDRWAA